MSSLFAKYRPRNWATVIGHENVKRVIAGKANANALGGAAYMLIGPSGCGKTTLAYLIAGEMADPEDFIEIDAGELTPAKLEDLERNLRLRNLGAKPGRAVIVNEVHGLRKDTLRKLLVVLERIPRHVCWLFTTTIDGQAAMIDGIDSAPFLSRCVTFRLSAALYLDQFARAAQRIAEREGLAGAPASAYDQLAKRTNGNFRMMLSEIESGVMLRDSQATEDDEIEIELADVVAPKPARKSPAKFSLTR